MHQWVDGMLNINGISKSTKGDEGIDGRNGLFVTLIRECHQYKTFCVNAHLYFCSV
jgi:hypothetical protein